VVPRNCDRNARIWHRSICTSFLSKPDLGEWGYRVEADGKVFAYTSDLNLALPGGAPPRSKRQNGPMVHVYVQGINFKAVFSIVSSDNLRLSNESDILLSMQERP
jgi:hypothetical protein